MGRYVDVLISMLAPNVSDRIYTSILTYSGHQILFMLSNQDHGANTEFTTFLLSSHQRSLL